MCQDSNRHRVWVWGWELITLALDKSIWWPDTNTYSATAEASTSLFLSAGNAAKLDDAWSSAFLEHRRALRKGSVLASAVAEHVFVSGHQMDLSKAREMDSYPYTQTRCLLESWHIQREQAPLNREKGTLPGLYIALHMST